MAYFSHYYRNTGPVIRRTFGPPYTRPISRRKDTIMNNTLKTGITLAVALLFTTGMAFADNRDRDKKRDGDCKAYSVEIAPGFILAKDRQRDQKRDGTCQSFTVDHQRGFVLAADQLRTRDRKKDGSCRTS
jgi:hypothetical protein